MKRSIILPVEGMTCASCVVRVEKSLKKIPGVETANVNLATEKVALVYDTSKTDVAQLASSVEASGYRLIVPASQDANEDSSERHGHAYRTLKKELIISASLAIPVVAVSMIGMMRDVSVFIPVSSETVSFLLLIATTIIMIVPGKRFFIAGWKLLKHGTADMNTLVAVGTGAAYGYSLLVLLFPQRLHVTGFQGLYLDTSASIITLVLFGRFLEARAKDRTGTALKRLLTLQPKTARVIRNGMDIDIPLAEILMSEVVLIRPGEKIPVDGTILNGTTSIDESMITGESIPVSKTAGQKVIGGTINKNGSIEVCTTAIGKDTVVAQIVKLVEEAQGSKASIQTLADKISAVFVPAVIGIAMITFLIWYFVVGVPLSAAMVNFVAVLIIACPCAMGLATPTAIMVGTGQAAAHGILIKDVASLERLRNVNYVVVDKTGTLTEGKPAVVQVECYNGFDEKSLLFFAASVEKKSQHPLGDAIVRYAVQNNIRLNDVDSFRSVTGLGLTAQVNGTDVLIGNYEFMKKQHVNLTGLDESFMDRLRSKRIPVIVAINGVVGGVLFIIDPLKESSKEAITELSRMNIRVVMVTGDTAATATATATDAGIDQVYAEIMPGEKANHVKMLQARGGIVAMVGDGINDAPGLAQADVGIAMGRGTDVAIETADITLMNNDPRSIVDAIVLSRKIFLTIKQNFFWALIYNLVGIPVAAFGLLHPIFAAAAMAGSSVSVVSNSLRLKKINLGNHQVK
jgi:Cu+-exporting ATPase